MKPQQTECRISEWEPLAEINTEADWLKPATGQLNYAGFFSPALVLIPPGNSTARTPTARSSVNLRAKECGQDFEQIDFK